MYYIISNPVSGRKKNRRKKVLELYRYLNENNIEFQLYESAYFKHPTEIAKKITTEHESGDIIVIGGDGTFNEVLNGITDLSKWNVGLIPAGSGNDFAECLNLPKKNLLECLKVILNKNIKPVDYIKVNDKICLNVMGTGIDVEVLIKFEKHTRLKGSFRYFYSLIGALIECNMHEFDVSIDDGPFVRKNGFIVALCNGRNFGGGISICPEALPDDNQLEFVFVSPIKKSKLIFKLIKLMKGKILKLKETEHIHCKKAVFRDNKNILLQIDGNLTDDYNEYRCEIVSKGINMYR